MLPDENHPAPNPVLDRQPAAAKSAEVPFSANWEGRVALPIRNGRRLSRATDTRRALQSRFLTSATEPLVALGRLAETCG